MKGKIAFSLIAVILTSFGLLSVCFGKDVDYTKGVYQPDPEIERMYQSMLNADGTVNLNAFDNQKLTANHLGALILAGQKCSVVHPDIPILGLDCAPVAMTVKYQNELSRIPDGTGDAIVKNLAQHPDERVRTMNISYLMALSFNSPKLYYDYLRTQDSALVNIAALRNLDIIRTVEITKNASAKFVKSKETKEFVERMKSFPNPYISSVAYEFDMTPDDIANAVANSAEGISKVYHSPRIVTKKEAEAVFLLFKKCTLNEKDLTFDNTCHTFKVLDELMSSRVLLQSEVDFVGLVKRLSKHENPIVRGVSYAMRLAVDGDALYEDVAKEKDPKVLAAFVQVSKIYFPNRIAELQPFYKLIAQNKDPRLHAFVKVDALSAASFEAHLLKLAECDNIKGNCQALVDYKNWMAQFSELSLDDKKPIFPVIDKYLNHKSEAIQIICASMATVVSYVGYMPRSFDEYMKDFAAKSSTDVKLTVISSWLAYVQAEPELAEDADIKRNLLMIADSINPNEKSDSFPQGIKVDVLKTQINSSFK